MKLVPQKKRFNPMPECTFTIVGSIADFTRIDNLYKSLKREAEKGLSGWTLTADVKYVEKEGEKPEK